MRLNSVILGRTGDRHPQRGIRGEVIEHSCQLVIRHGMKSIHDLRAIDGDVEDAAIHRGAAKLGHGMNLLGNRWRAPRHTS